MLIKYQCGTILQIVVIDVAINNIGLICCFLNHNVNIWPRGSSISWEGNMYLASVHSCISLRHMRHLDCKYQAFTKPCVKNCFFFFERLLWSSSAREIEHVKITNLLMKSTIIYHRFYCETILSCMTLENFYKIA